jgi:hypothetical protein
MDAPGYHTQAGDTKSQDRISYLFDINFYPELDMVVMNWLAGNRVWYKIYGDEIWPDIVEEAKEAPRDQMSSTPHAWVYYRLYAELEIPLLQCCGTWEPSIMVYDPKAVF